MSSGNILHEAAILSLFRLLPITLWGVFCFFISLYLAMGEWVALAVISVPLVFAIMCIVDLRILVIAMLLGYATLFVFPNNFLGAIPFIRVERILIALVVGRMIFAAMWRKHIIVSFITQEKLMFAFWAVLIVSFLTTVDGKDLSVLRKDIAFLALGYVIPLTSFMVARRLAWDYSHLKKLMIAFVAVGVYQTVVGVLQWFFGFHIFTPTYLEVNHALSRVAGTFGSAPEYGAVLSICVIIAIWAYMATTDKLIKLLLLLCTGVILGGVAMSLTRAPWLALLIGLIALFVLDKRVRPLFLVTIGFAFVAALIALPWLLDSSLLDPARFYARLTDMNSIYNRVALYATALNMIVQNPFLGVGFGLNSFKDAKLEYIISVGSVSPQYAADVGVPHNEFLHIGILSGMAGLILFISILVFIFRNLRLVENTLSLPDQVRYAALYIRIAMLTYCINALFVEVGYLSYLGMLVFFLAGFILSFQECETEHESKKPDDPPDLLIHNKNNHPSYKSQTGRSTDCST